MPDCAQRKEQWSSCSNYRLCNTWIVKDPLPYQINIVHMALLPSSQDTPRLKSLRVSISSQMNSLLASLRHIKHSIKVAYHFEFELPLLRYFTVYTARSAVIVGLLTFIASPYPPHTKCLDRRPSLVGQFDLPVAVWWNSLISLFASSFLIFLPSCLIAYPTNGYL